MSVNRQEEHISERQCQSFLEELTDVMGVIQCLLALLPKK